MFTFIIPAAVLGSPAATAASPLHSSGRFSQIHKLPMFGFLGWGEGTVLLALVSLGFDMGTGINCVFCGHASVMVTTTAKSTAPPTGTTLSNG